MTPEDIRDIHGPISIPYWWIPYAIAAAVIVALALVYAMYRVIRRRRERAKTAAQIALERIARARQLLETRSSAEFSDEVSDAVRVYIEARFDLRAPRRTTEEFLRDLLDGTTPTIKDHRGALENLLSWCDLAKFARVALSPSEADSITGAARTFVEATSVDDKRKAARKDAQPLTTSEVGT